jgi:hypothetical protein
MPTQLPLTFQQQWLWNLKQRHGDWRCILTYALRLSGALSPELLQMSLEEVTRRHTALRTRIVLMDGVAMQAIDGPFPCRLEVTSLEGVPKAEIDIRSLHALEEFSNREIDPTVGPLWNFGLFKVGEQEHLLVLTIHRLIVDCVAVDLLFGEIWLIYERLAKEESPSPVKLPLQYSDYATWQQQTYPQWLARHEAYWNERLAGVPPLRWPVSRGMRDVQRGSIGRMKCLFGAELSAELRQAARRKHTLSAMFMLAVYVAVVSRWCQQNDFVVPFNVAGRQSEHKNVIGYFSHILYLRLRLTGQESFAQLLSLVSNEFFRALSHQDFGTMATREPECSAGTFFQWISWHQADVSGKPSPEPAQPGGLRVERFSFREFGEGLTAIPPGVVDVEMTFFDTDDGIYALGVYRADLFTADTMERFVTDLRSAAAEFVRDRNASIAPAQALAG